MFTNIFWFCEFFTILKRKLQNVPPKDSRVRKCVSHYQVQDGPAEAGRAGGAAAAALSVDLEVDPAPEEASPAAKVAGAGGEEIQSRRGVGRRRAGRKPRTRLLQLVSSQRRSVVARTELRGRSIDPMAVAEVRAMSGSVSQHVRASFVGQRRLVLLHVRVLHRWP